MYKVNEKETNVLNLNINMLNKTLSMFKWSNLPETCNHCELEKQLQKNGYTFFLKHEGHIYHLSGGLGGEQDVYGNPTEINISNPALNINKTFKLTEGVLVKNDSCQLGLLPLIERANYFLNETDITIKKWLFNSRIQKTFVAATDNVKDSVESYLEKIELGEDGTIIEPALIEALKLLGNDSGAKQSSKDFIELRQYLKSNLYNELGINSNFNMKRERMVSNELEANNDSLFPLVYNMMEMRIKAVEEINYFFDLEIGVDFNSIWKIKEVEISESINENSGLAEASNSSSDEDISEEQKVIEDSEEDLEPTEEESEEESEEPEQKVIEDSEEDLEPTEEESEEESEEPEQKVIEDSEEDLEPTEEESEEESEEPEQKVIEDSEEDLEPTEEESEEPEQDSEEEDLDKNKN